MENDVVTKALIAYNSVLLNQPEDERNAVPAMRAAIAAMLETVGEPVAWAYEYRGHGDVDTRPGAMDITRARTTHRLAKGWTETPLYSLSPLTQALAPQGKGAASE